MSNIREATAIEILSQSKQLFSAEQLAALLGVTRKTIYRLASRGEIPYAKIGAATRFDGWRVAKALGVL